MTIKLLTDYPYGRYTIPIGSVVSVFDSNTENSLIAQKVAVSSAAAVTWTVPAEVPAPSSITPAQIQALVTGAGNFSGYLLGPYKQGVIA